LAEGCNRIGRRVAVAVDARDQFGNSALTVACQNGNKRIAKVLLRQGADINQQNSKGNSPMHYCFAFGYAELGEYLISKGTTTQQPLNGADICEIR
jgi:ankyrin repeat protein